MLREFGESVFVAVRQWADPRDRALRKRRRARRRSIRYSAATGATAVGAAGLVVLSAPVWAVVAVGGGAAALAVPATVAVRKYRMLRNRPLPPAAVARRPLPPLTSAAREPMLRLARAERGLHEVLTVIAQRAPVPPDDLDDTIDTADSAVSALVALSNDVVAMERIGKRVGELSPEIERSVAAACGRLDSGVREYENLLAAAARMTIPAVGPGLSAEEQLRETAEKLDGWAEALAELATPRQSASG